MRSIQVVLGFAVGIGAGFLGVGALAGIGGSAYVSRHLMPASEARQPAVVAAHDLAPGAVLQFDDVAQRQLPAGFVSASFVRPDAAMRVLGRPVIVPVKEGEPLLWTDLPSSGHPKERNSPETLCASAAPSAAAPNERLPEEIRARLAEQ